MGRVRLTISVCVTALGAVGLFTGAARADQQLRAAPPNQYLNPNLTLAPGEALTFQNLDLSGHDVTSQAKGPDGKPLFSAQLIGPAQTTPVTGVQRLVPGSYAFFCSIHPWMTGTITVTGSSASPPQASQGESGSPPPQSSQPKAAHKSRCRKKHGKSCSKGHRRHSRRHK